ncbi:hypothetical protein BDV36DRAFT_294372 [Aspergillus pseudocaelatus]|uniref:Uncharacterized protein n=1 Tax=Aspergillus pseudocaelatus TaxID=1825620 RepID=A0ABQ6WUM4_9EURO|nr:hypothetical protein BDV36DRAFT_294372 [Aspergillus pseudocaelatus]
MIIAAILLVVDATLISIFVVEAYRPRNKWTLLSSPSLWAVLYQLRGIGFIAPFYFMPSTSIATLAEGASIFLQNDFLLVTVSNFLWCWVSVWGLYRVGISNISPLSALVGHACRVCRDWTRCNRGGHLVLARTDDEPKEILSAQLKASLFSLCRPRDGYRT